ARQDLAGLLNCPPDELTAAAARRAQAEPAGERQAELRCRWSAAMLPEILDSQLRPVPGRLEEAAASLTAFGIANAPEPGTGTLSFYGELRRAAVETWEELCH
ncbi:MAG: hypothetical protein HY821_06205, partial [Acidobacteria bacterium]|nr:hypothetical protein [Acidobacteriota bacterium]